MSASTVAEGLMSNVATGFALLVVGALFYAVLQGVYSVFLHPLRAYPGPLLWRAYQWPYALSCVRGTYPFDTLAIHKKYGPVVRITPWMLCYTDSSALKEIYGRHNQATEGFSEMSKNRFEYQRSANGSENLLGAIGQDDHSRFQKLFTHAFSERGMREMQPRIQSFVDLMVRGLKEAACDDHADMLKWYNWTTFDLIGELAFGESFHCLETKSTHPWIAVLLGNLKTLGFRMVMLLYGLDRLLPYLTPKRLLEHRTTNMRYTREKMAKRMEKGEGQGDFFDKAIAQSDFKKGTGMTRDEMDSNAASLVLAGSETTATLLTGVTFLLCKHPDILERLNKEVRSTFTREEDIDLMSVGKLEYMLAVLDEALRIYPPAPNTGARIVPPQGYVVAGKWVSGGTTVRVQPYAANHSPTNFHRPDEFCPERWLAKPPMEFANDKRAAFVPFSLGARSCIGRNLAYAEMRLILTRVCWNFDMKLDGKRCENWMRDQRIYFLWEKPPLWIKLTAVDR